VLRSERYEIDCWKGSATKIERHVPFEFSATEHYAEQQQPSECRERQAAKESKKRMSVKQIHIEPIQHSRENESVFVTRSESCAELAGFHVSREFKRAGLPAEKPVRVD
jgi:hypothetical protein